MYSLSKEEQWKILQREERINGRGRKKKEKTLIEQLRDMGGFGHDPDSEEEVRQESFRRDTRRPFQYSEDSVSDSEMSSEEFSGENAFWESTRRLFKSWIVKARRHNSWIEEEYLPLCFRFALRRPLMDEMSLQEVLQNLNVKLNMFMGDVRQPHSHPIGRSRKLMFGIDIDEERKVHPSSKYRGILPKGATEDTDTVTEEVRRIVEQDDEDMQEVMRRQLWTVYEHVQNGSVPLEKATWHYRDAFNTEAMSDETLVLCLQQFDIPTDHILTSKRDDRRGSAHGSAHSPSPSSFESSKKEVEDIDIPDATDDTIIDVLTRYIQHYRNSSLPEREVIPLIRDYLVGLPPDARDISEILNDFNKDERTAASLMWESGCENAPEEDDQAKNIHMPDEPEKTKIEELIGYIQLYRNNSLREHEVIPMIKDWLAGLPLDSSDISGILNDLEKDEKTAAELMLQDACRNASEEDKTSCEEDEEDFYDEYDRRFREEQAEVLPKALVPVMVPDSHGNDRNNHEATVGTPSNESNSPDKSMTEAIDHPDDFKENEPEQSEAMSIDQPLMSPTAIHPDTPRPKPALLPAATENPVSKADEQSDREPPRDREPFGRRRLLSPDGGMTMGIWGILMPTKKARRLAHQMNLPQATINEQVRSISPRRSKRRRASYAKTIVTFPKSKRKASMTLHRDTPLKSPKRGDHSDIFAREGEDQESFVLSHFDHDAFDLEDTCNRCLLSPCECACECACGSPPRSRSKPECPKCLHNPCVCGHVTDYDEAIPSAPRVGKPSFDALEANTAHRTQPKSPKQSETFLTYLARTSGDDDILATIRELNRLKPAESTVEKVKDILDHLSNVRVAGITLDADGDDDQEALRILDDIVESSRTLTDYKNDSVYLEEEASTTSDEHHLNHVRKGADIGSSLLNSSSGHEHVPALLPNPSASTAAFPKNESNVANLSVLQANNKPFASYVSPYQPISAPDSNSPHLESISDPDNAVQSSRFQASTLPDSSAAGDPSRAGPDFGSAARGELSTTGGRPSKAEFSPGSPAGSPPSSSAELSKQVSEHHVDAKGDTDHDTWGATLTKQPPSTLRDAGDSEVEKQRPPTPKPKARQLPTSIPPFSPRLSFDGFSEGTLPPPRPGSKEESAKMLEGTRMGESLKKMTEGTPPPSPRPRSKELSKESEEMFEGTPSFSPMTQLLEFLEPNTEGTSPSSPRSRPKESSKKLNATARSCLKSPVSDSLPFWQAQPGLPEKAGPEWIGLTPQKALEYAKEEAFSQRKSLAFYLEERRAVRTRIKIEKYNANLDSSDHSFFQGSNGSSGSSASTSTVALNKLFDKYRGTSDI